MTAPLHSRARGVSSVELLFGLILIVISASMLIGHVALRYQRDTRERNRVFAFMASKSVLAEVQAAAAAGQDIAQFDDGDARHPTLSLARTNASPVGGDRPEADGNFRRGGEWVWWRQIRVEPLAGGGQRALRRVTVSISKRGVDGRVTTAATMSTAVAVPGSGFPATQVFDLYLLAIENIGARGVDLAAVRPLLEAEIADLERCTPGLSIRTHWITKASYGRDPDYLPAVAPAPDRHVYHYRFDRGRASGIKAKVLVDGEVRNDFDSNRNAVPYTLADTFNHGMRLPAERAFHARRLQQVRDRRRAIAEARHRRAPLPDELADMSEEPTLRLLLEDLVTRPAAYRHAMILNLHGDVLPMPAIRNYADAAADPVALPGLRCVTHPERLRTPRDPAGRSHQPVVFRVYAYAEDRDALPEHGVCPDGQAISLRVDGVDLTDPQRRGVLRDGVFLDSLVGGVPLLSAAGEQAVDRNYRPFAPAKDIYQRRAGNEMFYFAQFVDPGFGEAKYTLIWLFHTPLTCPPQRNTGSFVADRYRVAGAPAPAADRTPIRRLPDPGQLPAVLAQVETVETDPHKDQWQGLSPADRLYGLEYLPGPLGRDLSAPGDGPKNTARWRLRITGRVFEERRFVNPRGEYHDPAADVRLDVRTAFWRLGAAAPRRWSTTHAWWAAHPDAVPVTERAQFLGDPRHSPYADLAAGKGDFADGYNPYFGVPTGTAAYPGIDRQRLTARAPGGLRFDVPRYLELLRAGLLGSGASFASLGAFGAPRVWLGGEQEDHGVRLVRRNRDKATWSARPWLGELRPDTERSLRGNLPAGPAPSEFVQVSAADLLAAHVRREAPWAGPAFAWHEFFQAERDGRVFGTASATGSAERTVAGRQLGRIGHALLPATRTALGRFGWQNAPAGGPDRRRLPGTVCRVRAVRPFYTLAGEPQSAVAGVVELVRGRHSARIVVDRLDGDLSVRIRRSLLALLDSHAADELSPRVRLLAPTEVEGCEDPRSVTVRWHVWPERIAGGDRSIAVAAEGGADRFVEADLSYALLYSRDAGLTWYHAQDDTPALPGRRPVADHLRPDAGPGPEAWVCPTPPDRYPADAYLWRVEVYGKDRVWHGTHHQRRVDLVR